MVEVGSRDQAARAGHELTSRNRNESTVSSGAEIVKNASKTGWQPTITSKLRQIRMCGRSSLHQVIAQRLVELLSPPTQVY